MLLNSKAQFLEFKHIGFWKANAFSALFFIVLKYT